MTFESIPIKPDVDPATGKLPAGKESMSVRALLPYFGGKRTLSPKIVAEFGPHHCFWEPFCGSLAVLFAKPRCRSETVNDLNRDVVNLARVAADDRLGPELHKRLSVCMFSEDVFQDAIDDLLRCELACFQSIPDSKLQRAYSFFIVSWVGRNGTAGAVSSSHHFCVRYTTGGGDPCTRFRSAVASIPAWFERLQGVVILNRDAFVILDKIADDPGTVIYCDPPYVEKACRYLHDFEVGDHRRLATALSRFKKARVLVSYYPHEFVDELYEGWTRRTFVIAKASAHHGRRGANDVRATELLLINGPSVVAEKDLFSEAEHGES